MYAVYEIHATITVHDCVLLVNIQRISGARHWIWIRGLSNDQTSGMYVQYCVVMNVNGDM